MHEAQQGYVRHGHLLVMSIRLGCLDAFKGFEVRAMPCSTIFPLLGAFDHGMVAGLPLSEQALVADQDDLNGNNDRNELVPDWQRFALTELDRAVRQNTAPN